MLLNISPWREIQSDVEAIEENRTLFDEANFIGRVEAIDRIEFHILGRIGVALGSHPAEGLMGLKYRAEWLRDQLEEINARLFQKLRAQIRSGSLIGEELKHELERYGRDKGGSSRDYDGLDVLVGGLLRLDPSPQETQPREPEMVFYQPTPARIILELLEKTSITRDTVFYDLGSGLGHVCILVNLLTGARVKGIEFEPAFCDYARRCASGLNLSRVKFINVDARTADYSDGTIFFMYTPFRGGLLKEVLQKLRRESDKRTSRICTYGPCTLDVSNQTWLRRVDQNPNTEHALAIFETAKGDALEER
jgi:SAM-dependent methyltransferase